jgi:hypothetical protein
MRRACAELTGKVQQIVKNQEDFNYEELQLSL